MRISEVYLNSMYSFGFIFLLRLQHELLQDGVIARDDADGEHFTAAAVRVLLPRATYAQPVSPVVNGVCRVRCWLEHYARLHFPRDVIVVLIVVAKGVVPRACAEARRRRPGCRLELAGALPFGSMRQPQHQPVIGVVLLRKVRSQKEGCVRVALVRAAALGRGKSELTIYEVRPVAQ